MTKKHSKDTPKIKAARTTRRSRAKPVGTIEFRSECAIARTLDVVGDKWSLLIIRDILMRDKRTYSELATSPETIPTNILAQRLKWLVEHGLLQKEMYQKRPPRYEYTPTPKCKRLLPILDAMISFGRRELDGKVRP